nr:thiJ/pfpI-family protein [Solirubrobacterales bacterium]
MARVLIPIPSRDFDPSEVAVSWEMLRSRGHDVVFATPDGKPGAADELMLTGSGFDPWSHLPGLRSLTLIGRFLRADSRARRAYAEMEGDASFRRPGSWPGIDLGSLDGLLLPGGHRARGMREYLESEILQAVVA